MTRPSKMIFNAAPKKDAIKENIEAKAGSHIG